MENSKKIVLFDIDHTLFDTALYQSICYQKILDEVHFTNRETFLAACNEIYKEQRKVGSFHEEAFIDTLSERLHIAGDRKRLVAIFNEKEIFDKAVYPDADKVLEELTKLDITLGIFSAGTVHLQQSKIDSLLRHFSKEHIYIHEVDKKQDIPRIVEKHTEDTVFVVDDLRDVLYSLKLSAHKITTILIKREDWWDRAKIASPEFMADYTISSLNELTTIIN